MVREPGGEGVTVFSGAARGRVTGLLGGDGGGNEACTCHVIRSRDSAAAGTRSALAP